MLKALKERVLSVADASAGIVVGGLIVTAVSVVYFSALIGSRFMRYETPRRPQKDERKVKPTRSMALSHAA